MSLLPAVRVLSLDLDGTLIHPAAFNAAARVLGFGDRLEATLVAYQQGRIGIEAAFAADVAHFDGLSVTSVQNALAQSGSWTPGITEAVAEAHRRGWRVVVTTDQPEWAAAAVLRFGVDALVASPAPTPNGRIRADFTPRFAKWPNLEAWLSHNRVPAAAVAHVGNGSNDIPVFQKVGRSIAVFTTDPAVVAAATHHRSAPATLLDALQPLLVSGQ
ncbi:MAG: haloacid dehalogenase-like hydrolase [Candidatus Thermoplasmatota archaeon]